MRALCEIPKAVAHVSFALCPSFGFELEEREPRVEEKAEFFHSDFEKFGSKKVPALMQEY